MAVSAAQQLVEDNAIDVNSKRFLEAFNYVDNWSKKLFGIDLDPFLVKRIVEGSYNLYKNRVKNPAPLPAKVDAPLTSKLPIP